MGHGAYVLYPKTRCVPQKEIVLVAGMLSSMFVGRGERVVCVVVWFCYWLVTSRHIHMLLECECFRAVTFLLTPLTIGFEPLSVLRIAESRKGFPEIAFAQPASKGSSAIV